MRFGNFIRRLVPAGIVLCCLRVSSQQIHPPPSAAGGAEGRLTVTATVVSSVGLVTGPDGELKLVYANSVDPRDNVSRLDTVVVKLTPMAAEPEKAKKKAHRN
jgi:hypothetical protein